MKNSDASISFSESIRKGISYWYRKFIKIWPVWILVLLLDSLLVTKSLPLSDLARQVLLLHAFIPMPVGSYGSIWFISALLFCYLCAPSLCVIVNKIERNELSFIILVLVLSLLTLVFGFGNSLGQYKFYYIHISPIRRLGEFFLGMLTYKVVKNTHYNYSAIGGIIVFTILIASCLLMHFSFITSLTVTSFSILVISILYMYGGPILNRFMGNRIILWISHYFLYIYIVQDIVSSFFVHSLPPVMIVALVFAFGLLLGTVWETMLRIIA